MQKVAHPNIRFRCLKNPKPLALLAPPNSADPIPNNTLLSKKTKSVVVLEIKRNPIDINLLREMIFDRNSELHNDKYISESSLQRLLTIIDRYTSHMADGNVENYGEKDNDEMIIRELHDCNLLLSETNIKLAACVRSNTNVQYLGSSEGVKNVSLYVSKYMCKDLAEITNSFSILRSCLQKVHDYPPEQRSDVAGQDSIRTLKTVVQKYLNTLNGAAEIPAEAAVHTLLGGNTFICSEKFRYINVKSACEETIIRNQEIGGQEADDEQDEHEVENEGEITNPHEQIVAEETNQLTEMLGMNNTARRDGENE